MMLKFGKVMIVLDLNQRELEGKMVSDWCKRECGEGSYIYNY